MNVYLKPQRWMGKGICRVASALERYAPDAVRVVATVDEADLEIVHVVGCGSLRPDLGSVPYAIVQYCYRTTEQPLVEYWRPVWQRARAVWSYYELPGNGYTQLWQPLGVDPGVFYEQRNERGREYAIATHGYVAETEAVKECHAAARQLARASAHLGPNLHQGGDTYQQLSEEDVAALWSRSERVAALRRVEGFELPGVEGLLCGARPVAFDAPHYRRWYGDHADYVPEVEPAELTRLLVDLFARAPRPVGEDERATIRSQFDWSKLATNFWEKVL